MKKKTVLLLSIIPIVIIAYLLIKQNIDSKTDKALIEALTTKYKEHSFEVIKQAKKDSIRYVHNYDSIQVFRSENAKQLLNEIKNVNFVSRDARKHYADSLSNFIR